MDGRVQVDDRNLLVDSQWLAATRRSLVWLATVETIEAPN